ncbi:MAG: hypothetical protein JO113_05295 [Candidatus Eremiobacteraeota bacterium]|nr:hypothetical protein [Candidatus Eremiobacteraeota bacterium]
MPLQNRVTPFGDVVALPGRGTMMGNRGILHDDARHLIRPWKVRRWIACVLDFRGRHRDVMTPHRYTELFFLDETAAFAAGHRPCRECRYADYRRFAALWEACHGAPADADSMDRRLHADRLNGKAKRTYRADLATLPDGAYVAIGETAWLVWGSCLHAWSDSGYKASRPRPPRCEARVLTPRAIVAILAAGYRPAVHFSVDGTRAPATGTNQTA